MTEKPMDDILDQIAQAIRHVNATAEGLKYTDLVRAMARAALTAVQARMSQLEDPDREVPLGEDRYAMAWFALAWEIDTALAEGEK